jgi:branched-chain amino acid transport system permease protein
MDSFEVVRATTLSRYAFAAGGAIMAVLVSMPFWADPGTQRTLIEFLYLLALAQTWNLLAGYGGLVSIGQQAYIGLGGYALVMLTLKLGLNPFVAVVLCGLFAGLVAVPTYAVLSRLQGAYFAIGTWVIADTYRLFLANFTWLGGGSGISITEVMQPYDEWWRDSITFWMAVAIGVGSIVAAYLLLRSRHGIGLTAIRDSEAASESLGVSVWRLKRQVYVVVGAITGMVGALIFMTKLRVSPDSCFSVEWSALMIFIVVIGGIGTIEGPIVGTVLYFLLRNLLSDYGSVYLIALGSVAVLVMLKQRSGIWGTVARRFDWRVFPVQRRIRRISGD